MHDSDKPKAHDAPNPPVSPEAAELLARPDVLLHLTDSDQSEEAILILERAQVHFGADTALRQAEPAADWHGLTFQGVAGIQDLASMLEEMEQAFLEGFNEADLESRVRRDPRVGAWMRTIREQHTREAWRMLDELRHHRHDQRATPSP